MPKSQSIRKTTVGDIDADVLAYTAGRDVELDRALIAADCLGTAAHAIMLSELPLRRPILSRSEARKVCVELGRIAQAARAGRFVILPEDQDGHLAIERTLTRRLGDAGKRIHTARSRNDQVATALRIYSREELLGAIEETAGLARALIAFGRRHARVPMAGRTHLQPAMPSSVGLWAAAWGEGLLDDLDLLLAAFALNDQCPLGAAASYGVPLPINRPRTAQLLGFSRPAHTTLHAIHTRGKVDAVILHALGQAMVTISRLAQDLILFSMPEFGYVSLPRAFCTGCSIMPQKSIPDVCELARARAARVLALGSMVSEILRGMPSGYQRDLQETKEPLMEGFATTRATLRIFTAMIPGIEVHRDALRRGFTPDVFATDRALELVAEGMPFRDAYHHVKAHLSDLQAADPRKAIADKRHLGAPMGVDYAALQQRAARARSWASARRRTLARVESRLLGS